MAFCPIRPPIFLLLENLRLDSSWLQTFLYFILCNNIHFKNIPHDHRWVQNGRVAQHGLVCSDQLNLPTLPTPHLLN